MENKIIWSKEFVYYLGYLWADGYVSRNNIQLEIKETDGEYIKHYLDKISFIKFNKYKRKRDNFKPTLSFFFCDCKLYDNFFKEYFYNKSINSPDKLINDIPDKYIKYFFQGLIDGDGCFYISKDTKNKQFSIVSSYEQNWNYIISLFEKINIKKYEIKKRITKKGKSSVIRICNYDDIFKLYEFLYKKDRIGLKRKFDICEKIIKNKPKYTLNNSIINKKDLLEKINEKNNINEVSKYFQCSNKKIYNYCKKYNINKNGFIQKRRMKKTEFLNISESKEYIQKFNLKSKKDWINFCKEGQRPQNIPSNPYLFYEDWVSYGDWLGYKKV